MADLETRLIASERLLERTRQKHKKEIDRLHRRIRQLEAQLQEKMPLASLNDLAEGGDLDNAGHDFGQTLIQIAEMATDGRLDEAQCFLRARTLAQEALDNYEIEYVDNTFGGKSKTNV